jgi:hypothetical protein
MITHQIVNVLPTLAGDGRLVSLQFTVIAMDGELREDAFWNTPCSLPVRDEPYTQTDYTDKAGEIAAAQSLYTQLNAKIEARKAALLPPVVVPVINLPDTQRKQAWATQVNEYIRGIISKAMDFQMGYIEREAEATRYKLSGYVGVPNTWVTRFADNVKMPYKMATDLILSQAVKLREDNKDLEDLRMDKYLITGASSLEVAEAHYNRIMAAAAVIEKTL